MKGRDVKGYVLIKVEGLNQMKLVSFLTRSNIQLFDLNFVSSKEMTFFVLNKDLKKLNKLLKNKNINYSIVDRIGTSNRLIKIINNYGIIISVLIFIIFCVIFSNFVLNIKINGCEVVKHKEIESVVHDYLSEKKYLKNEIVCSEIEDRLMDSFNGISFASVITRGNYVVVDIKEKLNNLETSQDVEFDVVKSNHLGYVTKLDINQGTAVVKVGDLVRVDESLVLPYVLDSKGNKEYVVPKGEIELEIVIESGIAHEPTQISLVRTGKKQSVTTLKLFDANIYSKSSDCIFPLFETEKSSSIISQNNILPLVYEKTTYHELKQEIRESSFEVDKENLIKKAREIVYTKLPSDAIILNEGENVISIDGKNVVQYYVQCHVKQIF